MCSRSCPGTSLGILREGQSKEIAASFPALPPEVRAYARRPELLVVTKSTSRSTVHRPGYPRLHCGQALRREGRRRRRTSLSRPVHVDRLQRQRRARSRCCGARSPPSSNVPGCPPADTPARRWSTSSIPIRATSCSRPTMTNLLRTAKAILHLGDRQRLRLFVRRDAFERFLSCLIYAPRENYTTELRQKWQQS